MTFPATRSAKRPSTAPRKRAHPDFPLRGFVHCESCGRGLTGSWSKGRNEYYAYYHCRPGCRAVNVTKATLEGLFADELALLQPTPGYMRLLKESVLRIWKVRKAAVREELDGAERAAKAIQEELDRLDEAFPPPTSGCRPHSISGSGSNNCSFQTESRSTENGVSEAV